MTLHTYNPIAIATTKGQVPTSYGFQDIASNYSKVKSSSHYDDAHLHPLTNIPTKYQLPTPYSFQDTVGGDFIC